MIIFGADGKVTGIGACNQFSGEYEVKWEQITVGTINWGSENCPNPDMRQENHTSILLEDTADFKIADHTVTLTKTLSNGIRLLSLLKQSPTARQNEEKRMTMNKFFLILGWCVSLALVLAACAPNEPAPPLVGTTWKLTSFGHANSPEPALSESEGRIIFGADGKVTGIGACNYFNGEYQVKGEQIA